MIAWGIDIGLTGALSRIDRRGDAVVLDMPVKADGTKGNRIDGRELYKLIRQHTPAGEPLVIVFEDVRPRPTGNGGQQGNTIHSQGSLMRTRGAIEAVLDVLGVRAEVVQPQTWKRWFGLLRADKDASRQRALVLYPAAAHMLARKKDHNRAEALLLAHYAMVMVAEVPIRPACAEARESDAPRMGTEVAA